jgi:hypothetical protein
MFRYSFFLIVVISILFSQPASAQKVQKNVPEKSTVSYFYEGGSGEFEFPWSVGSENRFVVWSERNSNGAKTGLAQGIINAKTKVTFLNPELKGESVSLLRLVSGKTVAVTGRFRQEGTGEASNVYCEELVIAVIKY